MKKIVVMLTVMLFCSIASAQVNKTDPPTAITSPGMPPIENATQKINRQAARNAQPTPAISQPAINNSSVSAPLSQPSEPIAPTTTTVPVLPGQQMAYPTPQGAVQQGQGVTTGPVNGTNNPAVTLPSSNTTNQGKVP